MSTEITIREANAEDITSANAVFKKAFEPLRSIYRPTAQAAVSRTRYIKESNRLVAEINSQIVGSVELLSEGKCLHVIGLAVLPEFQRMGIAHYMIESIICRAKRDGHNIVALNTIKETGNVSLFNKMGFNIIRENIATWCTSDLHAEIHEVRMERKIETD